MSDELEQWKKWLGENGRLELIRPEEAGCRKLSPPCPNCGGGHGYPPEQDPHGPDKPCGYCVLCCDRGRCCEEE